ncbi:putative hydro-lyase [Loigolactobacillus binensis]|uniref:Putative hydro-lyase ACFQZ7_10725 n=1 Tax=Loigolactobacillus binensis TaxID=2559922 RepID=A0ABW3EDI2_9LACO|nr:putative hydro-lyase [Loigolactobacillus binensis]
MSEQQTPVQLRHLCRSNQFSQQTSGRCPGYTQANLVILPERDAYDFLLFAQRNPKPCPILEVTNSGSRRLHDFAQDVDLARDFPRYRIYQQGKLVAEPLAVVDYWRADLVSFLIGCSFSFEAALLQAGIEMRHITEQVNVPMYNTNIVAKTAGRFHGNYVVSMRPIPENQVVRAVTVTEQLPQVHGTPLQIGNPAALGITDLARPDYGDAVTIKPGEVPVFWACGVTPQAVVMQSKPEFVITHAPGHMLVTDIKDQDLKYQL